MSIFYYMSMKSAGKIFGILLGLLIIAAAGFSGYIWFSGGDGEASREVAAVAVEPTEPEWSAYDVDISRSEARFLIDEVLRGTPNTVVGVTDQIDGSVAIRFDRADVEVGEFEINVRTIRTDDEMRDRSIRTLILESNNDAFEFSSFRPAEIEGIPESIGVGDELPLKVTGDLTVRDVTREVTFDLPVRVDSEEEISGYGSTTITWDDFDITIPYVGGNSIVSAVDDKVILEIEFVAVRRGK